MSLLNDVLRDLEARRSRPAAPVAPVRAVPGVRRRSRMVWLIAAIALTTVATALWQWPPARIPLPAAHAEAPTPLPAIVVETAPVPIRLTSVSALQQPERLELQLGFDGAVEYRTERGEDGRSLSLSLPGVAATAALPALGELVAQAELREQEDGVALVLQLAEQLQVRTALEHRAAGAVLTLQLEREPVAAVPAPLPQPPPAPRPAVRPAPAAKPAAAAAQFAKQPVPPTPAELAARAYAVGLQALEAGRGNAAEAAFREALAHHAAHVPARRALAEHVAAQGRALEAEALLREGLTEQPESALAQQLARLLLAVGRDAEAVQALEAALPAGRDDGDYLALLAALYQRQGQFRPAAQLYALALQVAPGHGPWQIGRAIALESAGERAAAAAAYRAALQSGLEAELRHYAQQRLQALRGGAG